MHGSIKEFEFSRKVLEIDNNALLNTNLLPGRPDIYLPKDKVAIFFDGCYWHNHTCRSGDKNSFSLTVRDVEVRNRIRELGVHVIQVWECEWDNDAEGTMSYLKTQLNLIRAGLLDC